MSQPAFYRFVADIASDHLGPEKDEGIGLLWKEGGFTELLIDLHERAPRVLAALAQERAATKPPDERFAAFVTAWSKPSLAERQAALAASDLAPPIGTFSALLEGLEPPMAAPYRDRIEGWLERAAALEGAFIPPPSPGLRPALAVLRAHLGLPEAVVVDPADLKRAEDALKGTIPTDAVWILATLGRTPEQVVGQLEELDAFYETHEVPQWRRAMHFRHLPLIAVGENPRRTLCVRADLPLFALFDRKGGFVDPETAEVSLLLRKLWAAAEWDGGRPPALSFEVSEPAPTVSRALHPKFGEGEILKDQGDRLLVRFGDGKERTMLRRFLTFE